MSAFSAAGGVPFSLHHNLGDETAYSMLHVPIGANRVTVEDGPTERRYGEPPLYSHPRMAPEISRMPAAGHQAAPAPASTATEQRLLDIVERLMARLAPYGGDPLQQIRHAQLAPRPPGATLPDAATPAPAAPAAPAGPSGPATSALAPAPAPAQPGWLVPLLVAFGVMNVLLLGAVLGLILIRQGQPAARNGGNGRRGGSRKQQAGSPSWLQQVASEVK
jgi:hypothetical protein